MTKKRIIADAAGSPHVNGTRTDSEEPREGDSLETFRKQAIYRRMKYYSRENERNLSRIAQLERQNNVSEAGFAAIKACWAQVVETIHMLIKPEPFPQACHNIQEMFNLTASIHEETLEELSKMLAEHSRETQGLLARFVELSQKFDSSQIHSGVYAECQEMKTECLSLRSQIEVIRSRLQDAELQREQYYDALVAAESQVERLRSHESSSAQGTAVELKRGESEERQKPFSPARGESPHTNGSHAPADAETVQEMVQSREARIAELEQEGLHLRNRLLTLEMDAQSLSIGFLQNNPLFSSLVDYARELEHVIHNQRSDLAKMNEEIRSLSTARTSWDESSTNATSQAIQELKSMLAKRDADLTRLRDQRDQYQSEAHERKQLEVLKQTSMDEITRLSESRAERISVLETELSRLRTQLAANVGYEDLMVFFCNNDPAQADFVESLKSRVMSAEIQATAFSETLSIFQDDNPSVVSHMRAEAEARQKLAGAICELERYQSVYGKLSTFPPDTQSLAKQLQEKEDEIKRLKLLDQQREQSEASLYTEIDKLSNAWEALESQVKNKVFDLTAMEERLTKGVNDRLKIENKYYAAMREKEAIDLERKNLLRNNEKQAKSIEKLVDTERSLRLQLKTYEEEVDKSRKVMDNFRVRIDDLDREKHDLSLRLQSESGRLAEGHRAIKEREANLDQKRAELRKVEDALIKSKKTIEREATRLKEMSSTSTHSKEEENEKYAQSLLSILKCSTCKINFRDTLISKCRHTFCKGCVEARIATRQRKCPFCSGPFSQSDVHPMFFQ